MTDAITYVLKLTIALRPPTQTEHWWCGNMVPYYHPGGHSVSHRGLHLHACVIKDTARGCRCFSFRTATTIHLPLCLTAVCSTVLEAS